MNQLNTHMLEQEYIQTKAYIEESKIKLQNIKDLLVEEFETNDSEHLILTNVYKIKGRVSTSWKNIAETFDPSDELIEANSKISEPTYGIKIRKAEDE
jgi:hypothetical protein